MRRCDLGKDALRLVPIGAQQSTRCGGLSLMKDLRTEQKKWCLRRDGCYAERFHEKKN